MVKKLTFSLRNQIAVYLVFLGKFTQSFKHHFGLELRTKFSPASLHINSSLRFFYYTYDPIFGDYFKYPF
ncbi:hypothetical protein CR164_11730 [Prosthecochloris marina]|uniref:Uncharacterized protein n=1 Tax=Prosthecochloris marina TaxID=2017681 RepID=A0A317T3K7_9CHLB|nr:hypothetical protein CR164_11730 [Prosthecochloris marina]